MKCYKFLGLFLTMFFSIQMYGQGETSTPTAGFDTSNFHGFFVQSQDGQYRLEIGMYTQIRYQMNWRDNTPDSVLAFSRGYQMARTRIFFEGNFTDKFYYHFRSNVNSSGKTELIAAFLQWNIDKKSYLRLGRQFMALGLEDWMFPTDLASIDFSAHDFTYAIWSSFGVQYHYRFSEKNRIWVGIGNGAYGGRRNFPHPKDSDIGLTTRFEWNLVGEGWDDWGSMVGRRNMDFGILVGVGLGQLFRDEQIVGPNDAVSSNQINLDFSMKGGNFRLFTHGSTTAQHFKTGSAERTRAYGFYGTLGYWIHKSVFAYARYDLVARGNIPAKTEDYSSPGIGVSYYPFHYTNKIRFTIEYNHLSATLDNTIVEADSQLGIIQSSWGGQQSLKIQVQFGF